MGAVAMLQPEHEAAAVLVVTEHRARPIPAPALAGAGAAQRVVAHRMRKGQAATHAPRRRKEGDARPTAAAQRIRLVDSLAASEAPRRQHPVDDGPANHQKPAPNSDAKS